MVVYMISPMEKSELRINPDDFTAKLIHKWIHATAHPVTLDNDPYILRWSIEFRTHSQLGGLQVDYQTVAIEDFPDGTADFALWYRSIIPLDCKLTLYDDDFSNRIELNGDTTKEQILDALLG